MNIDDATEAKTKYCSRRGMVSLGLVCMWCLGASGLGGCLPRSAFGEYTEGSDTPERLIPSLDATSAGDGPAAGTVGSGQPAPGRPPELTGMGAAALGVGDAGAVMVGPNDDSPAVAVPDSGTGDLSAPDCGGVAGETVSGDTCRFLSGVRLPWPDARDACDGWGGTLVSIRSEIEDDSVGAGLEVTIWIGANDRDREGTFTWVSGEPFEFERFARGEPNNLLGLQDCVERRSDSTWVDRGCEVDNFFMCERSLGP